MVSVGPDGACQWTSGSIQKHWDHISSSSGSSATTFRLFDHITVSHSNGTMNISGDLSPLLLQQQPRTMLKPTRPEMNRNKPTAL